MPGECYLVSNTEWVLQCVKKSNVKGKTVLIDKQKQVAKQEGATKLKLVKDIRDQ